MLIFSWLVTSLMMTAPLEVIVFDSSLQRVVGYGKQQGAQLTLELLEGFNGPVVTMFLQEKVTSVQGVLNAGQLTLSTPNGLFTLNQYFNTLDSDLKLTVLSTPKLSANVKNPAADPQNNKSNNSGSNNSGSSNAGSGNNSGSSNSGSGNNSGSNNSGSSNSGSGNNSGNGNSGNSGNGKGKNK
ncbi:hypothetical protein [Deinococcus roseus]|uniref:Uncharacterized protein n=1 Tax=Deinococcus roseus TaxID=392414 RepID=A0ABQ2D0J4_9DEIO|nr:hypothetical protein [Deinococcus roseus]GGJ27955.1 hypothetical protein GCM10008938_12510 [Deinococcus roseus]